MFVMVFVITPVGGWINLQIRALLEAAGAAGQFAYALVLSATTAFDLGGPVNKAAGFVALGFTTEKVLPITARTIAIVTPSIGLGLSTLIDKKLVQEILEIVVYEYGLKFDTSDIIEEFIYHIYFLMERLKYGVRYHNNMKEKSQLTNLQTEIQTRYDSLSKRLKQVAKYILDNSDSIVFDTVAVIAEKADVPPSTLIRFASEFGFSGFNEMKQIFRENLMEKTTNYTERLQLSHKIAKSEGEESPEDILTIFSQANSQALHQLAEQTTNEQINEAAKILKEANNIFIIGLKRSFSAACYLNYALQHLDCRSFLINGLGGMFDEQLNQVKEGDVVVAISFSPYAAETVNISKVCAKKGVKQISITDSQISPLLAFSDIAFVIKEAQVLGFRSQCSTMTLVQTLAIVLGLEKEKDKDKDKNTK